MSEKWLSIVEYARHYNISDMTVRRRIKIGRLSAQLKDGKYYILVPERSDMSMNHRSSLAGSSVGGQRSEDHSPRAETSQKIFRTPEVRSQAYKTYQQESPPIHESRVAHQPLAKENSVSLDAKEFFSFCEKTLSAARDFEKLCERNRLNECSVLEERLRRLEGELREKNLTISRLHQDVEDLEILLKMMESSTK